MAHGIHRLTQRQIERAASAGRTVCDGGGLYLQDGKSWIYRYKLRSGRRSHYLGLGPLALVDLGAARELALAARKLRHAGIDPIEHRKRECAEAALAAAKSMTFDDCVRAYLEAHCFGWRNPKHRQQWQNTLKTYASPVIGKLPVQAIDVALVLRVLERERLWTRLPETASRVRGRIESVLAWATVRGYRSGPNPAEWRNNLDHLLPAKSKVREVRHFPTLPYDQLPGFTAQLRRQQGVAARALEFVILTATRTGDVIGQGRDDAPPLKWQHVDLTNRLWTIPKTKSGAAHRVPLSPQAIAVLEQMQPLRDASGIVFPGLKRGKPLSNGAMLRVLDRMKCGDNLTVHGLARASFKTWASERTNFDRMIIEACLSHVISDDLERAYRRGDFLDKRRRLMNAWGEYCSKPPAQAAPAVVALRAN
jgi:integrase